MEGEIIELDCDGKKCGQGKQASNGRYICPHNNLAVKYPQLIPEWDYTNPKSMEDYLPYSRKKVWWRCTLNPCGCHVWQSLISNRTGNTHSGCPYCSGHRVCFHNNLETKHPKLKAQWSPNNSKTMKEYSSGSRKKVEWICPLNPCGCHIWSAPISARTCPRAKGCPYCSSKKLCAHNNLETLYPELASQWHPDNKPINKYASGSGKKVLWICRSNSQHIWLAPICKRTEPWKTGCPHCSFSKGYSKSQIKWLTSIEKEKNINIQHACKPEGEFRIPEIGKVDGYCRETNTVYEYHGDYWHGNPLGFNSNKINLTNKQRYGDLYNKTIKRDERIRKLGYILVVEWETNSEIVKDFNTNI